MKFLFSEYELNVRTLELRRDGELVPLPPLPIRLLCYLVDHRDRVVGKQELFEEVWEDTVVSDASLTTAIRVLRRALDQGTGPSIVETRRGLGYRFRGSVTAVVGPGAAVEPPTGASYEPERRADVPADAFLGRASEQKLVRDALDGVSNGRGGVLLLEGEAGIGKTRLLEWCADEARSVGIEAILVRCREDEGAPALLPFLHVLQQIRRSRPEAIEAAVEGGARVLGQIFPELFCHLPEPKRVVSSDLDRFRFRGYDALTELLLDLAEASPLALLFDDIHRADPSSSRLLEFIGSRIANARILIVATLRPESEQDPSISALARDRRATTRSLERLGASDVADLIETYRGSHASAGLAELLWRQTGGNPFFLHQVIPVMDALETHESARSLADALPHTVRKAVEQTCAQLSESAHHALRVASVIGREFSARHLARLLESPVDEVLFALEEAVKARLLIPARDSTMSFRYVHLLVRDLLYQELATDLRSRAHFALASMLASSSPGSADRSAEIAHHFAAAGTIEAIEQAVEHYARAAQHDAARIAYDSAISRYRRALDLLDSLPKYDRALRCELLTGLASQTRQAGDVDRARELWIEAADFAHLAGRDDVVVKIALDMSASFDGVPHLLHVAEATSLLRAAVEVCDEREVSTRARLLSRLAQKLEHGGKTVEAEAATEEALRLASQTDEPRAIAEALFPLHIRLRGTPEATERAEITLRIRDLAHELDDIVLWLTASAFRALDLLDLGRFSEFDLELTEFARVSERIESYDAKDFLVKMTSTRRLIQGDIAGARAANQRALDQARAAHENAANHIRTIDLSAQRFFIEYEAGQLSEIWNASSQQMLAPSWMIGALWVYQDAGQRSLVARGIDQVMQTGVRRTRNESWIAKAAQLAQAIHYVGDHARADEVREWMRGFEDLHVAQGGGLLYLGPVGRYVGLLEETLGHRDAAEDWLVRARKECENTGAVTWEARILLDLARLHAAAPSAARRRAAHEHASAAREIAARIGMARVARDAEEILES